MSEERKAYLERCEQFLSDLVAGKFQVPTFEGGTDYEWTYDDVLTEAEKVLKTRVP